MSESKVDIETGKLLAICFIQQLRDKYSLYIPGFVEEKCEGIDLLKGCDPKLNITKITKEELLIDSVPDFDLQQIDTLIRASYNNNNTVGYILDIKYIDGLYNLNICTINVSKAQLFKRIMIGLVLQRSQEVKFARNITHAYEFKKSLQSDIQREVVDNKIKQYRTNLSNYLNKIKVDPYHFLIL